MGASQSTAPVPAAATNGGVAAAASGPTMRAWIIEQPGDVGALTERGHVAVPQPQRTDVQVRVMAAGLNFADVKRAGQQDIPFPAVGGLDGAGTVEAVGADVAGVAVGDRVHFHCDPMRPYGSLAEVTVVPAALCHPVPDGLAWTEAAALPCAAWTAYAALHDRLRISAGDGPPRTILITGGAGGVGGYAVSLAKLAGLRVIATCSPYNAAWVTGRGADLVVDYTAGMWGDEVMRFTGGAGVDYALDTVDSRAAAECVALLTFGGALCVTNGAVPPLPGLVHQGASVHYVYLAGYYRAGQRDPAHHARLRHIAAEVVSLAATGRLASNVGEVGDWSLARDALLTLKRRHLRGKLVIDLIPLQQQAAAAAAAAAPAPPGAAPSPPAAPPLPRPAVFCGDAGAARAAVSAHAKLGRQRWSPDLARHVGMPCSVVAEAPGDGLAKIVFSDTFYAWVPPSLLRAAAPNGGAAPPSAAAAAPAPGAAEDPPARNRMEEVRQQVAQQGSRYYVPPQYIQHVEERQSRHDALSAQARTR